jgi:uncharacterized membrane protein HdeD (DUF308 family)
MSTGPLAVVKKASGWSIVWAVLLIIFGMLAIGMPLAAAVAVATIISWLLIFAGVAHFISAFHTQGAGSVIWRILVGLAYVVMGIYLLMHPLLGVASLTLLLAWLFLIEGVLDLVAFWQARSQPGATWVLFDGIVTLILAILIWRHWPSSSIWVVGTLVGISMIVSGVTRLMVSMAVRGLVKGVA